MNIRDVSEDRYDGNFLDELRLMYGKETIGHEIGTVHVSIFHDPWCNLLCRDATCSCDGRCNCNPVIEKLDYIANHKKKS